MISDLHIRNLVEKALESTHSFLVGVHVTPMNKIIVLLDREGGVSIKQCVEVSRFIEKNLDREAEDFELEVSSAGLDQPFKVLRQYQKNIGRFVEVLTKEGIKKEGKLVSVGEQDLVIEEVTGKGKKMEIREITNNIKVMNPE